MGVGGLHHSSAALHPGKRPGTHCRGRWVGTSVVRRWNTMKLNIALKTNRQKQAEKQLVSRGGCSSILYLNDAIPLCMCNKILLQSTVYTQQLNSSCSFTTG